MSRWAIVRIGPPEATASAGSTCDPLPVRPRGPLAALAVAEVISSLGSLMSVVALPWFVLETTGSPGRMSAVLAVEALPIALLGIPSARFAARLGARRALLLCDAVWAPAVALIPLLHAAGALSFGLLLALAFVAGLPWPLHYGAQSSLLPELAGETEAGIARASAVFSTASRLTYFAGPALGGALLAFTSASVVLVVDAATFALSFAVVALLVRGVGAPHPEGAPGDATLAPLLADRVLRRLTAAQVLSQAAYMAVVAAVPVLAYEQYGRDGAAAGRLLGAWGLGAVLGGALAFRLVRGRDALSLGAAAWCLQAAPLWLLASGRSSQAVATVALLLSGIGNGVRVPPITAVVAARLGPAQRAATLTASTALVLSGGFVTLLLAGPALEASGAAPVLAATAVAQTLAAALVVQLAVTRPCPERSAGAPEGAR
jgi:MFS family permease